jgi:hypothetical protein
MAVTPQIVSQLFATTVDLDSAGPPKEALKMKSAKEKRRALRFGSAVLASYLRQRHAMWLRIVVEELEATIAGGGSAVVSGEAEEALDLAVRVDAGGTVGVDPITVEISLDAGETWAAAVPLVGGALSLLGLLVTFSGTLAEGDEVRIAGGVDYAVRDHTVSIAAYRLLYNRGVDPGTPQGQTLRAHFDDAMAWVKAVSVDEARLDAGADATPGTSEDGPLYGGQVDPWEWMDQA